MRKFTGILAALTVGSLATVSLVACKDKTPYTAQDMANAIYFAQEEKNVTFQFKLDDTVERYLEGSDTEKQVTNITWSENDDRIEIKENILYPTYDANNLKPVTITATVEVDGEKASTDFKFRLDKESNYDEFIATEKGKSVSVSGYIAELGEYSSSYENFSMNIVSKDKEHSYYAYRAKCDEDTYAQLSVGQYIGITGEKDAYNGPQIKNGQVTVLPGESFTETAVELTAADITAGEKSPNLNRLVKVNNLVVRSSFDSKENLFSGNVTYGDKTEYVAFKVNKYYYEDGSETKEAIINKLKTVQPGDTVNLEGYFAMYNGKVQLSITDPEKVTVVSNNADLRDVILAKDEVSAILDKTDFTIKEGEVELSNTKGATITATLSDTKQQSVKLDGNKLSYKATGTKVEVTLTVTVSKGEESETFEYDILCFAPANTFERFINASKGDKIDNISGIVTHAKISGDYAYVIVQDKNGAYYIRYKATDEEMKKYFEVGYEVSGVKGTVDLYGGLYQLIDLEFTNTKKGEKATLPTPKALTEDVVKDESKLKLLMSSLVSVTATVSEDGKQVIIGETKLNFYVDKKLVAEGQTIPTLEAGKTYNITGFIGCNKDKLQINPITATLVEAQ